MTENQKHIWIGGGVVAIAALVTTGVVISKIKKGKDHSQTRVGDQQSDSNEFGTGNLVPEDFGKAIGDDLDAIKFLELRKVENIDGIWTNVEGTVKFNPGERIGEIHAFQRDYYEPTKLYLIIEERGFNWFNPEYYRLEVQDLKI
ncbi:hypothetical protein [Nonlabens xiamenensis]|uniref:hypothetical protein n=1 Tax=Nonlabens xiamenensis TaxID=2341043 RepID=UPI000F60C696|nr:hypothetical protein [Nonlabens xiamenensis]